jgi:hypothetical protein
MVSIIVTMYTPHSIHPGHIVGPFLARIGEQDSDFTNKGYLRSNSRPDDNTHSVVDVKCHTPRALHFA